MDTMQQYIDELEEGLRRITEAGKQMITAVKNSDEDAFGACSIEMTDAEDQITEAREHMEYGMYSDSMTEPANEED